MKKSTLLLYTLSLLFFNGCGAGLKNLMIDETDSSLKSIRSVKVVSTRNSVGFEWKEITDKRIHGVNVYRAVPTEGNKTFELIGSTNSVYTTHFVDTSVKANTNYLYTFTTYVMGKESKHGDIVDIKTQTYLPAVSFAKLYMPAKHVLKLLWIPHSNQSVSGYRIERSTDHGSWQEIAEVSGRLSAEYIDTFVSSGHQYEYRILSKTYDAQYSYPSAVISISL